MVEGFSSCFVFWIWGPVLRVQEFGVEGGLFGIWGLGVGIEGITWYLLRLPVIVAGLL